MCEKGDRNARSATSGASNNCTQLPLEADEQEIMQPAATLTVPITELCKNEGLKSIYFLAMKSADSFDGAAYYGVLRFTLDKTPPPAPTNLKAEVGEDSVELSWDVPEKLKR